MNYREWRVLLCAGIGALVGCDTGTGEPQSCVEDFDCPLGEVCEGATADASGSCASAPADAERTFGAASLEFVSGNEAFLLGVYSVPTGAAAVTDTATFSVSSAGATARVTAISPLRSMVRPDPTWAARSKFDAARWQRMHQRSGAALAQAGNVSQAALQQAACPACDADTMCWRHECVAQVTLTFTDGASPIHCNLERVIDAAGQAINVLVDEDLAADAALAIGAVEAFAATLADEQHLLGVNNQVATLDRDGDGRLTVVFTNYAAGDVTTDVVGFFDDQDFLAAGASGATGNEADLLWVRMPGASNSAGLITEPLAVGTLAHEYVHLASYATRVWGRSVAAPAELLWLDEGVAHLTEDLAGWGPSNVGAVAVALDAWPTAAFATGEDSVAQRGEAYLLLRHLVDEAARAAGATGAADAATTAAATTLVSGLLADPAVGFDHPVLRDAGADGVWRWLQAVYATGRDDVLSAATAHNYLSVESAITGNLVGIATTGTFSSARGTDDVTLYGPRMGDGSTDEILVGDAPLESVVAHSGSVLFLVRASAPGTVELRGRGSAQVDLHLRAVQVQ